MSRPFYSDAKKAKMCRFFLFSLSHFLFSHDFSGTIADRDVINTPLEPLRPADVPFVGFVDIALHFGGEIPRKLQFWGREWAFSSQTGKILKVSCYRNSCIDFNQILHNDGDH